MFSRKSWIDMVCGIYQIYNLVTNDIYIGSSKNISKRFYEHKRFLELGTHHSSYLQNAWNKYKSDNFSFDIIISCCEDLLLYYEQQFINQWNPIYNMCKIAGNRLGCTLSEETKKKISKSLAGRDVTDDFRQKMSIIASKRKNHRPNYKHSDETLEKMRKGNLGKIKNRKVSTETRLVSPEGTLYTCINNIAEFSRKNNLNPRHVSDVILGKRKSHKGWRLEK